MTLAGPAMSNPIRQHLIDPETCIRCNTCETRCPTKAIRHERNYVVDPEKCNFCMKCVRPCPTGAVDHYFDLARRYSIGDQLRWIELPPELQRVAAEYEHAATEFGDSVRGDQIAPVSASNPPLNKYTQDNPARAIVSCNTRVTGENAENDVRHIVLEFDETQFAFIEGQNVGVIPPGLADNGQPHAMRLYSVACPRDGEKPNAGNVSLAIKRVLRRDDLGQEVRGVTSNWLCDLRPGDTVNIIGPFGTTFLMPEDPDTDILMICTGTGAAPFRGFAHRRRRAWPNAGGKLLLIYGARTPEELPFFHFLQRYSQAEFRRELVFSRAVAGDREYVQDRLRQRAPEVLSLLCRPKSHMYICGLKGIEEGVDEALVDIGRLRGIDWLASKSEMRAAGRYHVESY